MTETVRLLGDAVADARRANDALRQQMDDHGIPTYMHLHHLLALPYLVRVAHTAWKERMTEVMTILAAGQGIEDLESLPVDTLFRLSDRAYGLLGVERAAGPSGTAGDIAVAHLRQMPLCPDVRP